MKWINPPRNLTIPCWSVLCLLLLCNCSLISPLTISLSPTLPHIHIISYLILTHTLSFPLSLEVPHLLPQRNTSKHIPHGISTIHIDNLVLYYFVQINYYQIIYTKLNIKYTYFEKSKVLYYILLLCII